MANFLLLIPSNLILCSSILIPFFSLIIIVLAKAKTIIRISLLTFISINFLLNIIILDLFFLEGVRINFEVFSFTGGYKFALHIEPLGLIFLNLIAILWPPALLYTDSYLKVNAIDNCERFLLFFHLSIIFTILIALAANLISLFICYELLTLVTAPLICHNSLKKNKNAVASYLKILLISSLLLFLPAILIIYNITGHGNFIKEGIIDGFLDRKEGILLFCMFIFGISKSAPYPLHYWLPNAMAAPYPVSALFHAVVIVKSGLFCIFKIIIYIFGFKYLAFLTINYNFLILFPVTTLIYSMIQIIRNRNIKVILAYSTMSQLALALMSAFLFTQNGLAAAVLHMCGHSFSKICLFYSAGNFYSRTKTLDIKDLSSIARFMPISSAIFLISSLSLIGLPPLAGFISKYYIFLSITKQEELYISFFVVLSGLVTAFCFSRIIFIMFSNSDNEENKFNNFGEGEQKLPKAEIISPLICLFLCIIFFFIQKFIYKLLIFI